MGTNSVRITRTRHIFLLCHALHRQSRQGIQLQEYSTKQMFTDAMVATAMTSTGLQEVQGSGLSRSELPAETAVQGSRPCLKIFYKMGAWNWLNNMTEHTNTHTLNKTSQKMYFFLFFFLLWHPFPASPVPHWKPFALTVPGHENTEPLPEH